MTETFAALLFAHALADFVLQTGWMVANKRRPAAMLAHIAVVLITAGLALGSVDPILLALAAPGRLSGPPIPPTFALTYALGIIGPAAAVGGLGWKRSTACSRS